MTYDFTTVMDRRGKDSVAADLNAWTGSIVEGKRREGEIFGDRSWREGPTEIV